MQTVLILHNIVRWAILLFGVWTVINAITGVTSKRAFTSGDNKSNLFFMISCDIQFLLGIILVFSNGWFEKIKAGIGPLMKNPADRFVIIEHGLIMIIAWILVHVGRTAVKKAPTDAAKHKKMLLFFGLALLLILISIPWPFRAEVARPWLRWFN